MFYVQSRICVIEKKRNTWRWTKGWLRLSLKLSNSVGPNFSPIMINFKPTNIYWAYKTLYNLATCIINLKDVCSLSSSNSIIYEPILRKKAKIKRKRNPLCAKMFIAHMKIKWKTTKLQGTVKKSNSYNGIIIVNKNKIYKRV